MRSKKHDDMREQLINDLIDRGRSGHSSSVLLKVLLWNSTIALSYFIKRGVDLILAAAVMAQNQRIAGYADLLLVLGDELAQFFYRRILINDFKRDFCPGIFFKLQQQLDGGQGISA